MSDLSLTRPQKRPPAKGRNWFSTLALLLSVATAVLILYPVLTLVIRVVVIGDGTGQTPFEQIAAENGILRLVLQTFGVIGAAALISVVFGSLFAWLIERTDLGMGSISRFLPVVPLLLPPIAGAIGWVILGAERAGYLNAVVNNALGLFGVKLASPVFNIFSVSGMVFVYVIYMLPQVYLTVAAALRNIDPALEEASRVSGASAFRTVTRVTLPSVLPAIISGCTIAVILGISLYSVPVILGGQAGVEVLSVRIVRLMLEGFPPRIGAALVLALVIAAVIATMSILQRRVMRAGKFAMIGGKGARGNPVRLGLLRWPARLLILTYICMGTVLPFIALVIASLQPFWVANIKWSVLGLGNYRAVFGSNAYAVSGLTNSVMLGVAGATAVMLLAAIIAFYTHRNWSSPMSGIVDMVTKLPAAVSNLVIGISFIVAFAGAPFHLHGTVLILFLAYLVLYMPQASITASAAMAQVGKELSEASLVSGASDGITFLRVTLPLMMPGLMAGWTMLFVLFAGDLTASAMLSGTANPVIGSVILNLWSEGSFTRVAAFATVVSVVMSSVVLLSMWLTRRQY